MPVLDWIGKKAVVNHHREVPYRLVHCDGDLSAGDKDAGNLLVQGDNLEALKALLPYYAGKVKCIYIDPPYNTGNEDWKYNDNVNSPEIKKWLGQAVGKEAEDLSRHDKWLCMMYPRLRLLRDFLTEDGVIFVSIDDNELVNLRLMMNEIFGIHNFIASFVWKRRASSAMADKNISVDHEYVVSFQKNNFLTFNGNQKNYKSYTNPDNDIRGAWTLGDLTVGMTKEMRPNQFYDLIDPKTGNVFPANPNRVWAYIPSSMNKLIAENTVCFPEDTAKKPMLKRFKSNLKSTVNPLSTWINNSKKEEKESGIFEISSGLNSEATKLLQNIFGEKNFDYAKPLSLICQLIQQSTNPNDLILDSFAGSGTTGHAVLDLNKQDGGNRKFILVEMKENIAQNVTAERLKRVINGYDKGGDASKPVEGLGGGVRYCHLGVPLFNEFGDIDVGVNFPDLAAHVFFAETGAPIPQKATNQSPYLGVHQDKAVYLLFSPAVQGFAREAAGNVLTPDVLATLPTPPKDFEGTRIVFGEGCTVSKERLSEAGITFKQIPYQIEGV